MTCIQCYGYHAEPSHCLESPPFIPSSPDPPSPLATTDPPPVSIALLFQNVLELESYSIWPFQILSLSNRRLRFLRVFS